MIIHGQLGIGAPMIVQSLAANFGTSISPVRDALNRLVGERLVEVQGGGGFSVPAFSHARACHLYAWHADIVSVIVKVMIGVDSIGEPSAILESSPTPHSIAAATADFFLRISACSPNPEHLEVATSVGERLQPLRLHEGNVTRKGEELRMLWNVTRTGNKNAIRVAMWRYHRRRFLRAGEIAAAANRFGPLS